MAEADFFLIKNWTKFQHYKDRNPPWIKLHVEILASEDWVTLADASRLLAVVCMVVAARNEGKVPNNPAYIKRVAYLDKTPDLTPLIKCGFLVNALADASEGKHSQAESRPETEQSRAETEQNHPSDGRAQAPKPVLKGTRLALDWRPSEEARAYARKVGLVDGEIDAEATEFREYFTGKDCAKPVKRDWDAAWQRWVRGNAPKRIRNRPRQSVARSASPSAARDSILAKAGIRRGDAGGVHADQGGWTAGDIASQASSGTVIDADGWRETSGSADRIEAPDAPQSGEHDGLGRADGGVPQAAEGLPGRRGFVRADDAAGHIAMVACVGGTEGAVGDTHAETEADACGSDLDLPAFLDRRHKLTA